MLPLRRQGKRALRQCNAMKGVDMDALQEARSRISRCSSALAVLIHFWFSPFYPESWDVGAIWEVLDVFMAIGIIACRWLYTCKHKRSACHPTTSSLARRCAPTPPFTSAAVLAVLFFWNWFDELDHGSRR